MRYLLTLSFLLLWFVSCACSQTDGEEFGKELHLRGLKLLKQLEERDEYQLGNAFASAVRFDSESQLQSFIEEFEVSAAEVVEFAIDNTEYLPDFDLAFRNLEKLDADSIDTDLVANFAYKLGTRSGDLGKLLTETVNQFVRNAPADDPAFAEGPVGLYERRMSEIRYHYQRGYRESKEPISLEQATSGIEVEALRDDIRARLYLAKNFDEQSEQEFIADLDCFESKPMAQFVLFETLRRLGEEELQSEKGRLLIQRLIQLRAEQPPMQHDLADDNEDKHIFEFQLNWNESTLINISASAFNDAEISKLYRLSKLSNLAPDLLRKKGYEFLLTQTPENDPIPLTTDADPSDSNAESPIDRFEKQLAAIDSDKQPSWIVNYVLRRGWKNRNIQSGEFPESESILASFEACQGNDPEIAKQICSSIGSFTPPTPAARDLLLQMMNLLPEDQRIVSRYEANLFLTRIRVADDSELPELKKASIEFLKRAHPLWASHLAFEFAVHGDKEQVNQLLEMIPDAGDKVWATFQCSMAFAHKSNTEMRYSHRVIGGAF